jgi:hypothetical protein
MRDMPIERENPLGNHAWQSYTGKKIDYKIQKNIKHQAIGESGMLG